jgi:hypothetical protein
MRVVPLFLIVRIISGPCVVSTAIVSAGIISIIIKICLTIIVHFLIAIFSLSVYLVVGLILGIRLHLVLILSVLVLLLVLPMVMILLHFHFHFIFRIRCTGAGI